MQTERILSTVVDLVELAPRATGTPGGERAAAYVAERFRAAGLSDVHHLEVPSYAWRADRCAVTMGPAEDPLVVPSSPILHSALSAHDAVGTLVDAPVIALTNARVLDGTGAPARAGQTLILRDGNIAEIGATESVTVPEGATVIDLTGKTVLPGLVMVHEHLYYPVGPGV